MRKSILTIVLALSPALGLASGGGEHVKHAAVDLNNTASLQRGAKLFVNYCLNCHTAAYMRYQRMAGDLGLSEDQMKDNLMFVPGQKIGDTMTVAMPRADGERWFGVAPPDLSVVARSRGPDWLYTYLNSFYVDESRPLGVDNLVFPKVGMPHVLWELQGWQTPVHDTVEGIDGHPKQVIKELELTTPGSMSPAEYDKAVLDLVSFLTYMGEPAQMQRRSLGVWVLLFLVVFTVLAYLLKKEYWKDVH
jgi:ubiquinol-cytochrome c reductase cytochrome c1 subunit